MMSEDSLPQRHTRIKICTSRQTARQDKHLSRRPIHLLHQTISHNAHPMSTHHDTLTRDAYRLSLDTRTTQNIKRSYKLNILKSRCKKKINHNTSRFNNLRQRRTIFRTYIAAKLKKNH